MGYKWHYRTNILIIMQVIFYIIGVLLSYEQYFYLSALIFLCSSIFTYIFFCCKSKNLMNIIGLFSLSWIGGIGLTSFKLSKLQNSWGILTWIVYACAFFAFEITCLIFLNASKCKKDNIVKNDIHKLSIVQCKRLIITIVVLDVISLFGMIFEWLKCGFLPVLSNKAHAYLYFHISGIHYFTVSSALVPALSIIYIMHYHICRKNSNIISQFDLISIKEKVLLCLSNMVSIFVSICIVSRFKLLFSVLLALVVYFYIDNIKFRYIIILFVCLYCVLLLFSMLRHQSISYLQNLFKFKNENIPICIAHPYMYICNNFENFNLMIKETSIYGTYHGYRLLFPLIALTGLKLKFPALVVGRVYTTKKELTTATFLYDAYYDFGLIGVVLYSSVIALLCIYVNSIIANKNDILLLIIGGQLTIYILLSFFTTWFSNPTTWFYFILSMIIYFYVKHGFENFDLIF